MAAKLRSPRYAVWADGSAYQNPGPGGYAALIVARGAAADDKLVSAVSGFHPFTTNIRMELTGIIAALDRIPRHAALAVYTDCESVAAGLAGRTRRLAHQDLWEQYEAARGTRLITTRWISSRAGLPWHRQADALARRMTQEGYHGGHCVPVDLLLGPDAPHLREARASTPLLAPAH